MIFKFQTLKVVEVSKAIHSLNRVNNQFESVFEDSVRMAFVLFVYFPSSYITHAMPPLIT